MVVSLDSDRRRRMWRADSPNQIDAAGKNHDQTLSCEGNKTLWITQPVKWW